MKIFLSDNELDDLYLVKDGSSVGVKQSIDDLMGGSIVEVLYDDLVLLRDSSGLTPGMSYRITDYELTVNKCWVKSAGHSFDIIVTALSSDALSEEASVVRHDGDEYFSGSSLNSWKVWYSLDNDVNKMYYACPNAIITPIDDEAKYRERDSELDDLEASHPYCWSSGSSYYYTDAEVPSIGDNVYTGKNDVAAFSTVGRYYPKGKGVIYRMVDEWGNDVGYDFKNMMFRRYGLANSPSTYGPFKSYNSTGRGNYYMWNYTFVYSSYTAYTQDNSGQIEGSDYSLTNYASNNLIVTPLAGRFDYVLNSNYPTRHISGNTMLNCGTITLSKMPQNNTFISSSVELVSGSGGALATTNNFMDSVGITSNYLISIWQCAFFSSTLTMDKINTAMPFIRNTEIYDSNFTLSGNFLEGFFKSVKNSTIKSVNGASIVNSSALTTSSLNKVKIENCSNFTCVDKNCSGVTVENCNYVTLTTDSTESGSLRNIEIKNLEGTSASPKVITHHTLNDTFMTTYQPQNSVTVGVP